MLLQTVVENAHDGVVVCQMSRQIAGLLGLDALEQTKISTAVSEVVRSVYEQEGAGTVTFAVESISRQPALVISVVDTDAREPHAPMAGLKRQRELKSDTGIISARRLVDRLEISSAGAGTAVTMYTRCSPSLDIAPERLDDLAHSVRGSTMSDPYEEMRQQNRALARTLEELTDRQDELSRLNTELEDTNRGVVALYAELDDIAERLKVSDDLKTRFLSNASHEFRAPVNSILALSRLLLEQADGPLTEEQSKQVTFILRAAEGMYALVNDLLDLAKVEAGMVTIRTVPFQAANLLATLRGMARPLSTNDAVQLIFESDETLPELFTDESKVAQILRNFISNAMKFTLRGEVRTSARRDINPAYVRFSVSDTGIGISQDDLESIFQEFVQVENRLQRRGEGTGLGLPLSRKLAELLGGSVSVESRVGQGSTFSLVLPIVLPGKAEISERDVSTGDAQPTPSIVTIGPGALQYASTIREAGYRTTIVGDIREAHEALQSGTSAGVLIVTFGGDAQLWTVIENLPTLVRETSRGLPIIAIVTPDELQRAEELGLECWSHAASADPWLFARLQALTEDARTKHVLIVDDGEADRYILREFLGDEYHITEAVSGDDALRILQDARFDFIIMDYIMPGRTGLTTLDTFRQAPYRCSTPVLLCTAQTFTVDQLEHLRVSNAGYISKRDLAPESLEAALDALRTLSTQSRSQ